jgi:hypothetical protein
MCLHILSEYRRKECGEATRYPFHPSLAPVNEKHRQNEFTQFAEHHRKERSDACQSGKGRSPPSFPKNQELTKYRFCGIFIFMLVSAQLQLELATDSLLVAPFDTRSPVEQRMVKVEQAGNYLSELLSEYLWSPNTDIAVRALRGATAYACLSSLTTIAADLPHNQNVAESVANNFQQLAVDIVASTLPRKSSQARGQISETSLIAALWWGVANVDERKDLYITPSTKEQDSGVANSGNGYDMTVRRSSSHKRQLIDAKTWRGEHNVEKIARKRGVSVITPYDITRPPRGMKTAWRLLERIARNESEELAVIYGLARARLKTF